MKPRINIPAAEPRLLSVMASADQEIKKFDIDLKLVELIKIRASQINGCGYCLDLHTKNAKKAGESDQRLFTLAAWWETTLFSEEEQIALRLTEEVTKLSSKTISEETIRAAIEKFGEKKYMQLLFVIVTINSWNRIAIGSGSQAA